MGMFEGPIPLQSLSSEPKNFPWERPPEMSDLKEVIDFYLEGLTKETVIDNLMDLLDMGTPVDAIVGAFTTANVMNGMHNVDVKLLVSPVIHEYIKSMGQRAGIEVVDRFTGTDSSENKEALISMINKGIDSVERKETDEEDDEGVDLMRQTSEMLSESSTDMPKEEPDMNMEQEAPAMDMQEELPMDTQEELPEASTGLMSRRGTM